MLFADVAAVMPKAPTQRLCSSLHSIVQHPIKLMPSQNLILTAPTSATLPEASSPHVTPTALPDLALHVTISTHLKLDDVSRSDTSIAMEWNGPHHLSVAGDLSKDRHYQHKYKDFIFDILPSGTLEKICAVVRGRCVSIFPELYVLFYSALWFMF